MLSCIRNMPPSTSVFSMKCNNTVIIKGVKHPQIWMLCLSWHLELLTIMPQLAKMIFLICLFQLKTGEDMKSNNTVPSLWGNRLVFWEINWKNFIVKTKQNKTKNKQKQTNKTATPNLLHCCPYVFTSVWLQLHYRKVNSTLSCLLVFELYSRAEMVTNATHPY